jgi:PAS domain S-box-containing protein
MTGRPRGPILPSARNGQVPAIRYRATEANTSAIQARLSLDTAYTQTRMPRSRNGEEDGRAENALTSHQLRTLYRTAFDGLFLIDDARRYVFVNEPAAQLLGVPAEEVVGRSVADFTPPELLPALERIWADFKRHGAVQGPYEVLRGDGSRLLIEYRGTRNFGPGQHVIAARAITAPQVSVAGVRVVMQQTTASLSPREREVLQLAAWGHSTHGIAEMLSLGHATVKTHFEHAYDKLGTRDRVSAVAECLRRGLIE